MNTLKWLIVSLWLLVLPIGATEPTYFASQGGILDIKIDKTSATPPIVRYGLQEVLVTEANNQWRILVGIPLTTLPGDYLIAIHPSDQGEDDYHIVFSVQQQPVNDALSINSHHPEATTKEILNKLDKLDFDHSEVPELPFIAPVNQQWRNDFGTQAKRNDNTVTTTTSISLETEGISSIHTPQKGIVSNRWQTSDGTDYVAISHGRGVYTVLGGLDETIVNIGDGIRKGALIGNQKSEDNHSKTLYWYCAMNGTFINPLLLTQTK